MPWPNRSRAEGAKALKGAEIRWRGLDADNSYNFLVGCVGNWGVHRPNASSPVQSGPLHSISAGQFTRSRSARPVQLVRVNWSSSVWPQDPALIG